VNVDVPVLEEIGVQAELFRVAADEAELLNIGVAQVEQVVGPLVG